MFSTGIHTFGVQVHIYTYIATAIVGRESDSHQDLFVEGTIPAVLHIECTHLNYTLSYL